LQINATATNDQADLDQSSALLAVTQPAHLQADASWRISFGRTPKSIEPKERDRPSLPDRGAPAKQSLLHSRGRVKSRPSIRETEPQSSPKKELNEKWGDQ